MSDSRTLPHNAFRVMISRADLALYVEGEGTHLASLQGVVSQSANASVAEGLPFLVEFGAFDGEALGVYVTNRAGEVAFAYSDEAEMLLARLTEAHEASRALAAIISPKGEPRKVGDHALHWWVAEVSLELRSSARDSSSDRSYESDHDVDLCIHVRSVDRAERLRFEGEIRSSRRASFREGGRIQCHFGAGATNTLTWAEGGAARLSWAINERDAKCMTELVARAETFGAALLFELRLGSSAPSGHSNSWSVDDVNLVAVGLLH